MLDIQKLLTKPNIIHKIEGNLWEFEIGPFPSGLWHSIGNIVRRTILAYSPSICITGMKIDGVEHEYSVTEWVKESIINIMLNFKNIRINGDIEEDWKQIWMQQEFKGIGKYYGKDLELPGGLELLTDDQYLFEITDPKKSLKVNFRLEKGYGYYSIDFLKKREREEEGTDVGLLYIDNSFKCVNYVTYEVEEVLTDFIGGSKDKVILKIETISDKIDPKDLLSFVAEVLISYMKVFIYEDSYIDRELFVEYEEMEGIDFNSKESPKEVQKTPIDILPLSERTRNALIKNTIMFVEDLQKKTKNELLSLKGVGRKAVDEIDTSLVGMGKRLGMVE